VGLPLLSMCSAKGWNVIAVKSGSWTTHEIYEPDLTFTRVLVVACEFLLAAVAVKVVASALVVGSET
jgi:hypothetical protein